MACRWASSASVASVTKPRCSGWRANSKTPRRGRNTLSRELEKGDGVMLTFERIDFDEFHTRVLPNRIARGNGALAADDVAHAAPFAVQVAGGGAYSYVPTGDSVEVCVGDEGARTVIEFEPDAFSDYANELHSCFGLV